MEPHGASPCPDFDLDYDQPCYDPPQGQQQACGGAPLGVEQAAVILDTPTPPDDNHGRVLMRAFWGHVEEPRSRRIWSRCQLGFHLPGDYYFTTLTTSPDAIRPIDQDVFPLRRWFKRHHPGYEYLQVLTDEGHGTVHICQRLPSRSPRINVKALRQYWKDLHQSSILKIKPVRNKAGLSVYLAEQSKKSMSREMSYQPLIIRWSRSRDWIPPHFIREWARWWHGHPELSVEQKAVHSREWIIDFSRDRLS